MLSPGRSRCGAVQCTSILMTSGAANENGKNKQRKEAVRNGKLNICAGRELQN